MAQAVDRGRDIRAAVRADADLAAKADADIMMLNVVCSSRTCSRGERNDENGANAMDGHAGDRATRKVDKAPSRLRTRSIVVRFRTLRFLRRALR